MKLLSTGIAAAAALLLGGCALQSPPSSSQLAEAELAHAKPPPAWAAGGQGGKIEAGWLASFNDPGLSALAEEALAYNQDLRLAAGRVEIAAIALQAAGGGLYPEVNLLGRTGGKVNNGGSQLSGLILQGSWEIDLWGRLRYGQAAADAQYRSAQADQRFASQSLLATLAKAWFLAAEASRQLGLNAEMQQAAEKLAHLAEERRRIGVGSEAEVALALANLHGLRDGAEQIKLSMSQSRRALEVMLGRYPAAEIALPTELALLPALPATGLPSELLERRPDVIAAERKVAAAFARSGEAAAARLPRLSLTAALSSVSSSIFVLQERNDPNFGVGASVLVPLLNGGQLQAQVDLRGLEQKQAAAAFAGIAQRAFNEVETALANEAALAKREPLLRQGLSENQRALGLEQQRYRVGSRDLRSVQQQQLATLAASISLLRVQSEQRLQRVNLHLALGGEVLAPK
ncbi:efflux transporter outer membrane subunit [Roseateles oligotrophus]|uniref:Efflux transporter outer membrane subunit n=1 Tax=Roseateles oligotrophus TaxID=1769250 RepID=A0ABT2YLW4_9BURK|nr:efflux transporter outer membrane subunit [Roseateles oligotrophus]MCV2371038.1 efflux transporter outer membrane subunit [Roseateles oligotrophus]